METLLDEITTYYGYDGQEYLYISITLQENNQRGSVKSFEFHSFNRYYGNKTRKWFTITYNLDQAYDCFLQI